MLCTFGRPYDSLNVVAYLLSAEGVALSTGNEINFGILLIFPHNAQYFCCPL